MIGRLKGSRMKKMHDLAINPRIGRKHLLRVGWRNFFSSYAVVSVFGSGGK
jgi:hypothetical protein